MASKPRKLLEAKSASFRGMENPLHAGSQAVMTVGPTAESMARPRASSMQLMSVVAGLDELLDQAPIRWLPWLHFAYERDEREYQELCFDRDIPVARHVMWCLLCVHVPVMLIDSLLYSGESQLLEADTADGAAVSAAEVAMWWYLLVALPFAVPRIFEAAPRLVQRAWKGWCGCALLLCVLGIFVRSGHIFAVASSREDALLVRTVSGLGERCANETAAGGGGGGGSNPLLPNATAAAFAACAAAALDTVGSGGADQMADLTRMQVFNRYTGGALMVIGCSFFGLVALTAATAAHLDHKHTTLLFLTSAAGLLVVQAVYGVTTHKVVFILMVAAGLLVNFTALRNDRAQRYSFLTLRAARNRADSLQVSLHGAKRQLRAFEVAAPGEKQAVQTVLEGAFSESELMDMCTIEFNDIKLQRLIGSGAHGEVIKAMLLGTPVVVKRMQRTKINTETLRSFVDEIKLMVRLRHPNIVQLIGASFNTFCNICMVVEWVERGDLHEVLKMSEGHGLTWNDPLLKLAIDAARGVAYLHGNGVIHRDIKSPNLLVSSTFGCKVSDFGLSKRADLLSTVVGTSLWLPPEIIHNKKYDEKADVWSFGVVLTEMATKKVPYDAQIKAGDDPLTIMMAVANKGMRPDMPPESDEGCPKAIRRLVKDCLAHKPQDRPSFVELLKRLQDEVRAELLGENFHEARPQLLKRTRGGPDRASRRVKKENSNAIQKFRTAQMAALAVSKSSKGGADAADDDDDDDDDDGGGGFQLKTRGGKL